MNQRFGVTPDQAREILQEMVDGQSPAKLTYQAGAGWVMVKSRFVGVDESSDLLLLEFSPRGDEAEDPPEAGQSIGVAFRRGSRKCVFDSHVVDQVAMPDDRPGTLALRLAWPEKVNELQRRLYVRTPVPRGRLIPVDLWIREAGGGRDEPPAQRGRLVDLSAGGISVELAREARPRWREDDPLSCRFRADPNHELVEASVRLTSHSRLPDGHVRLGLQFVGLDASEQGRQVLQQIHRMTTRLQRRRYDDR
ncbi:MAG: PilZ domain-containing protein [Planctomycetes bacterium]|nr:PilZ domain-containing protein [Planctomycetota bacterium]